MFASCNTALMALGEAGTSPVSRVITQVAGPNGGDWIPIIAVAGGILVALTAITFGTMSGVAKRKSYEQSRREIAAYVAEGSISPQEAERLLKPGKNIS